jgi:hypothetical protein
MNNERYYKIIFKVKDENTIDKFIKIINMNNIDEKKITSNSCPDKKIIDLSFNFVINNGQDINEIGDKMKNFIKNSKTNLKEYSIGFILNDIDNDIKEIRFIKNEKCFYNKPKDNSENAYKILDEKFEERDINEFVNKTLPKEDTSQIVSEFTSVNPVSIGGNKKNKKTLKRKYTSSKNQILRRGDSSSKLLVTDLHDALRRGAGINLHRCKKNKTKRRTLVKK